MLAGNYWGIFSLALVLSSGFFNGACEVLEGDACQDEPGYPPSTCKAHNSCTTLSGYPNLTQTAIGCGFTHPYGIELICCPNDFSETDGRTTTLPPPVEQEPYHDYLGTIRYYAKNLQRYVYRCTAIVISPKSVLTAASCTGKDTYQQPNMVFLANNDPRTESDVMIDVVEQQIHEDLLILEMQASTSAVNAAEFCTKHDMQGRPPIVAIGFAHLRSEGTNCNLFRRELKWADASACKNIDRWPLNSRSRDLSRNHLCVIPKTSHQGWSDDCSICLTDSTSVLHVQRPDGTYCVGGIATPLTDNCDNAEHGLYYTELLDTKIADLLNTVGQRQL